MKFFVRSLLAATYALAAPVLETRQNSTIPGEFIVVLKSDTTSDGLSSSVQSVTDILGGIAPRFVYDVGDFKGYHVSAADDLVTIISNLAEVSYVEPDVQVSLNALVTQTDVTWGLARISHVDPGSTQYIYDDSAGEGTYAYIIGTGIQIDHPDFGGRATWGASFVDGDDSETDGHGHGTHTAGTTGSTTYGVAKETRLIAVKVLDSDGSGSLSQVIAGIQWAVDDATSKDRIGKAVANLPLGSLRIFAQSVNDAAAAAVDAGLSLAVAAGNDGLPAILTSPASEPSVCTVAATQSDDDRASFSNWGPGVDIFAPGVDVESTWNNGSTAVLSGTSMATPHITGLGAYILTLEGAYDPIALCERLQALANQGVVGSALTTNNYLAYNGASS